MENQMNMPRPTQASRLHRSSQEMFPLVEKWLEGRENKSDFCAFHDLPKAVFAYWLKKYRFKEADSNSESGFVALAVKPSSIGDLEIVFPNGVKVCNSSGVGASFIRELVGSC